MILKMKFKKNLKKLKNKQNYKVSKVVKIQNNYGKKTKT